MRSQRHHRRNFVRPSFSPNNADPTTHFMKIVLPGAIHAENMRIPKVFVRRFENELCASEATIGVPDGRVWKMELKKSENEVYFCKGWEEFVKYYSLRFGFFLVFKYEGKSQFSAVIFDSSAAEIYYPPKLNSEKQNSAPKCRRKRPHSFDQWNRDRSGQGLSSKMKITLSNKQRAQNFEQAANRSFAAVVGPSNLNWYYMDVPSSFCKEYMGRMRPMKLQDCKGRKWDVNYHYKYRSRIRIGKGWIKFARANNVKEGDTCVFKLIKTNNSFVFQVTTILPC
ncbi:hypothetical protein K1719_027318 [Acacia pycnantha]|nr:hypothetical protein K1719_027318 [Acacia pycnantha]